MVLVAAIWREGPADSIFSGSCWSGRVREPGLVLLKVLFDATKGPWVSRDTRCACPRVQFSSLFSEVGWLPLLPRLPAFRAH